MSEQQQERVGSLQFFPVYTRVITDKDTVFGIFCEHIEKAGIELRDGDVVLVTSKIVSLTEGGLAAEKDITASETATKLSKEYQTIFSFILFYFILLFLKTGRCKRPSTARQF